MCVCVYERDRFKAPPLKTEIEHAICLLRERERERERERLRERERETVLLHVIMNLLSTMKIVVNLAVCVLKIIDRPVLNHQYVSTGNLHACFFYRSSSNKQSESNDCAPMKRSTFRLVHTGRLA